MIIRSSHGCLGDSLPFKRIIVLVAFAIGGRNLARSVLALRARSFILLLGGIQVLLLILLGVIGLILLIGLIGFNTAVI